MIEVRLSNNSPEEHGRLIGWMDVEIEDKQVYHRFVVQQPIRAMVDTLTCGTSAPSWREGVDYITLNIGKFVEPNRSFSAFIFDNTRENRDVILKVREFRPDVEWFRMWQERDRGASRSRSASSRLGWKRRDEGV